MRQSLRFARASSGLAAALSSVPKTPAALRLSRLAQLRNTCVTAQPLTSVRQVRLNHADATKTSSEAEAEAVAPARSPVEPPVDGSTLVDHVADAPGEESVVTPPAEEGEEQWHVPRRYRRKDKIDLPLNQRYDEKRRMVFPNRLRDDYGVMQWNATTLRVRYSDSDKPLDLPTLFLRDGCQCPKCVDPSSGQKTFSTTDLPDAPSIMSARAMPDGTVEIIWHNDPLSEGGKHQTLLKPELIKRWREGDNTTRGQNIPSGPMIPWDRAMYQALLNKGWCRVKYKDWIHNDNAFWSAFHDFCRTGLLFVTDVPEDEASVERIAKRIGPLQHTFYGWTWDVRSKPRAENVAYTNVFLGLHQDLMYHNPIPRVQLLHCLANSCEGGESLFASGIRAAYELQQTDPINYGVLTRYDTHYCYDRNGHYYHARRCTIVEGLPGGPIMTHWAPPFQGTQRRLSGPVQPSLLRWKRAATAFQKTIEDERNMYEYKLKPGECVIFDNQRVLHGRREFQTTQGSRWLKGAYISPQVFAAKETELAHRLGRRFIDKDEIMAWVSQERKLVRDTLPDELKEKVNLVEEDRLFEGAERLHKAMKEELKTVNNWRRYLEEHQSEGEQAEVAQ